MKILFLCTANSCRSILCEAMFNHLAPTDFEATLEQIRTRIEAFLALPLKQLSAEQLKAELALIGTF